MKAEYIHVYYWVFSFGGGFLFLLYCHIIIVPLIGSTERSGETVKIFPEQRFYKVNML